MYHDLPTIELIVRFERAEGDERRALEGALHDRLWIRDPGGETGREVTRAVSHGPYCYLHTPDGVRRLDLVRAEDDPAPPDEPLDP